LISFYDLFYISNFILFKCAKNILNILIAQAYFDDLSSHHFSYDVDLEKPGFSRCRKVISNSNILVIIF